MAAIWHISALFLVLGISGLGRGKWYAVYYLCSFCEMHLFLIVNLWTMFRHSNQRKASPSSWWMHVASPFSRRRGGATTDTVKLAAKWSSFPIDMYCLNLFNCPPMDNSTSSIDFQGKRDCFYCCRRFECKASKKVARSLECCLQIWRLTSSQSLSENTANAQHIFICVMEFITVMADWGSREKTPGQRLQETLQIWIVPMNLTFLVAL